MTELSPEHQKQFDQLLAMGPVIQSLDDPNIELLVPQLRPCVVELVNSGIWIKHPWVNSMIPLVGQANEIWSAKFSMMRDYLSRRRLSAYLFVCIERPWRFELLADWWRKGKISKEELRELLPEVWRDTEFPSANLDEPVYLFEDAGFLTDNEEAWARVPEQMTLYRGGTEDGISWTLSLEQAEWFARRFGDHEVWEMTADKSWALGHFTERGEEEIVIFPSNPRRR
jgi:hypothetical protein